jgi:hypothetical protein
MVPPPSSAHAQGIDNALDRVGSLVTPGPPSRLSRECRVLCLGKNRPPTLVPHAYPSHDQLRAEALEAARSADSAAAAVAAARDVARSVAQRVTGVLLVTVVRGTNLADRDFLKVRVNV